MLIKSLRMYGSNFLPPYLLEGIFIFMIGLMFANPVAFVTYILLGSIYSIIFTSVYYLWNGMLTLAMQV